MPHNLKMDVSTGGGSPADTGKADTTAANSVVNRSGISKSTLSHTQHNGTGLASTELIAGLRRSGALSSVGFRANPITNRMLRREAERKAAKAAKKGGAK